MLPCVVASNVTPEEEFAVARDVPVVLVARLFACGGPDTDGDARSGWCSDRLLLPLHEAMLTPTAATSPSARSPVRVTTTAPDG
jgi:hypothetical protein